MPFWPALLEVHSTWALQEIEKALVPGVRPHPPYVQEALHTLQCATEAQ